MTEPAQRCRAARRCADAETVQLEDGETERLGALIEQGPLCVDCVQAAVVALRELPRDLAELSLRIIPGGSQQFRDPDMPDQPRSKKAAPLPFDEYVFTLMELIDYETGLWAESVADADGLEWDSYLAEHSRQGDRVTRACALLGHRLTTLIHLPVQQHRAHSLTHDPSHGHDPDTTTRYRGDYWANEAGWEAVVRMVDLHRRATRHIGRVPRNHLPVPCPKCGEKRLAREHHNDRVICRNDTCDLKLSDDDYDDFLEHALETLGEPSDVVTRTQAAAMAGVRPLTIKKWVQRGYIRPLPNGGYRRVAIEEFLASRTPETEEN